ncbi:MAG TPA: glycosyltransferase [Phycisphaerae bacterium]|nr:glycosyltransferase [Phycisphaerae bacterium]
MRVFMLGWEFPPFISGGLGTACYGLTKGLNEIDVDICFVLPTAIPIDATTTGKTHVQLRSPSDVEPARLQRLMNPLSEEEEETTLEVTHNRRTLHTRKHHHLRVEHLPAFLMPYATPETYEKNIVELRRYARNSAYKQALRYAIAKANGNHHCLENWHFPLETSAVDSDDANKSIIQGTAGAHYEGDLFAQVHRFASLAVELAMREDFDIVHAHDWMTYPAGIAVAQATGKPLVVHVHSTEFDRSGQNVNQVIYDIERAGMTLAKSVVCVSHLTANIAKHRYGVPENKITVIYNAVELPARPNGPLKTIAKNEKIVLFLGRVTMQKGPEYFLQAAKRVVEKYKKVRFIVAGSGDMITRCIKMAADLGIGKYVTFTGFLRGQDVDRVFRMADLYVMPSVSEPFGIAPLEALSRDVPVIISKQSGVSEILTHVLKVDFWDTDEMANKILAVLRHEPLGKTLQQHSKIELHGISWHDSALKLKELYATLV